MAGTVTSPSDDQPLRLRDNFLWTLAGNAVYAASQWGVIAVLAKLGSSAVVGQYAFGLAVAAPVFTLCGLHLRAIQATDVAGRRRFGDYLGLRVSMATSALVAVCLFSVFMLRSEAVAIILLVAAIRWVESVVDITHGRLQLIERMDLIGRSMIVRGLLGVAVVGGTFASTLSLEWSLGALLFAWIGLWAWDLMVTKERTTSIVPVFDWNRMRKLARLALPLGAAMALTSLNANIPRYFVKGYLGDEGLGYYSAIVYVVVAGTMVVGALGQAASPRLARLSESNAPAAFMRILAALVGIGILISCVGTFVSMVWGKEILTYLYTEEYAAYSGELFVAMLVSMPMFIAMFFSSGMTAIRSFRVQAPVAIVSALTVLGVAALLVPTAGVSGGLYSIAAGAGMQAILYGFILSRWLRSRFELQGRMFS